jgi:hypothetical protein
LLPDEMPDSFLQAFGSILPEANPEEMQTELTGSSKDRFRQERGKTIAFAGGQ